MFMAIEPKKRGRPPMSPEKKAEAQARRSAAQNKHHKSTGWAAQKKYRSQHGGERYEAKVTMPAVNRDAFTALLEQNGMTISELVLGAVYEKYGIDFRKPIEKD